jgi:hypothetical protein
MASSPPMTYPKSMADKPVPKTRSKAAPKPEVLEEEEEGYGDKLDSLQPKNIDAKEEVDDEDEELEPDLRDIEALDESQRRDRLGESND